MSTSSRIVRKFGARQPRLESTLEDVSTDPDTYSKPVADNGTDTHVLDSIFGGALLDNLRSDAQTLHAAGQRSRVRPLPGR